MKRLASLEELAAELEQVQKNLKPMFEGILLMVGEDAKEDARERLIGRLRPLSAVPPFPGWPPLADSTIAIKTAQGLGKNGNPRSMLYATGAMHDDVGFRVSKKDKRVAIGTNIPYAAAHEYGNSRVPPRPFLGPALVRTVQKLYPRMERIFCRTLSGLRAF